jgi:hypothetical protein
MNKTQKQQMINRFLALLDLLRKAQREQHLAEAKKREALQEPEGTVNHDG